MGAELSGSVLRQTHEWARTGIAGERLATAPQGLAADGWDDVTAVVSV